MFLNIEKYKYFYFIILILIIILICYHFNNCYYFSKKNINNINNFEFFTNNKNLYKNIINEVNNTNKNIDSKKNIKNNIDNDDDNDSDNDNDNDNNDKSDIDNDIDNYILDLEKRKNNYNLSKIHLVLARYNEDISYLKTNIFDNLIIHLYNKGTEIMDEDIINNKNIKIYKLPNVGKCDHTYLYHIINNYNNLPELIIFLPASFYYMNFKRSKGLRIIKDTKEKEKPVFPTIKLNNKNYIKLYNFKMNYFKTRFKVNQIINNKKNNNPFKLKLSPIRPYGEWFKKILDEKKHKSCYDCDYVIYTGMFSVRREMLLKYDIDLYKKFICYIDDDINPEAGHYIERIWACLFYPFKDSLLIDSKNSFF